MTTKKRTAATAAKPAAQASTTTIAQVPAKVPTNTTVQTQATEASPIRFAKPKAERQKSTRPYCEHIDSKGARCQLRALDGRTKCVNHVPAEERLTQDEAQALLALVGGLDESQQIRLLTRAIGWYKVKQLMGGKPEGDVVLNELVG